MQDRLFGIWWAEDAQVLELGWDMVKYEVKFNIQPSYYSLMLSPEIIDTEFKGRAWRKRPIICRKNTPVMSTRIKS